MTLRDPSRTVPLTRVLDALGEDLRRVAPPALSARATRALRRHRPAWWRTAWGFSGAAVCALGLLGSVVLVLQDSPLPADPPGLPTDQATLQRPVPTGFVAVAGAERWTQLMQGDGAAAAWVVPSELPRERLAALGLPFDPGRAGETVRAELLLHPSGELLAVRVMNQ
jgi:hypothetical protein